MFRRRNGTEKNTLLLLLLLLLLTNPVELSFVLLSYLCAFSLLSRFPCCRGWDGIWHTSCENRKCPFLYPVCVYVVVFIYLFIFKGGHDIANTPLLTFPASAHSQLEIWTSSRLERLLRHYVRWLSMTSNVQTVACLADLQQASKDVIKVIVEAVEGLEVT